MSLVDIEHKASFSICSWEFNCVTPVQLHTLVSVASVTGSFVKTADRNLSDFMGLSCWEAAKLLLNKLQVPK